jgi:FkbM family methyltransferase
MRLVKSLAVRAARRCLLPLLPASRKLPWRCRFHLWEGSCESELRHLDRIAPGGAVAVDVGANEGLYSCRLARRFARVVAFEVNDDLTQELAAWNPGNVEIVHTGLSSREGETVLYIPLVGGRALTGWASLAPGNCPEAREHREKRVRVRPLDDWNLSGVAFMKIDVEGHELEVLRGAEQTLARNRPTILVEVKPPNQAAVAEFLAGLGYERRELRAFVHGAAGSPENWIFLPGERAPLRDGHAVAAAPPA